MNDFKLMKFEQFVSQINESIDNSQIVDERETSKISGKDDTKLKIKQSDQKIKVVDAPPKGEGEVKRYEFKVISKESDQDKANTDSLNHIGNLVIDQIAKKAITGDMVGFLKVDRAESRPIGDYIYAGVLSFYPATKFPNLPATPMHEFPIPVEEAIPADIPITSQVVEAGEPSAQTVKIYDYSNMQAALPPEKQRGFDSASVATVNKDAIPEPTDDEAPKPVDGATTQAETDKQPVGAGDTTTPKPYEGLTKNLAVNPKVTELQKKIIALGTKDPAYAAAAQSINNVGGADGKYGDATAKAIAIVIGKPDTPITTIDNATATALETKLANIAVEDTPAPTQPVATQPTTQPAAKPGKIQANTPAGKTFTINEMNKFNYFNYARQMELLRFRNVNEGKVDLLKSGANGGQYKAAWDQAVAAIGQGIDMNGTGAVVTIQLNPNDPNSKFNLQWKMEADGSVTLSVPGERSEEADTKAIDISNKIVALFADEAFWATAKGSVMNFQGGDDENKGLQLYNNWYTTTIMPILNTMEQTDPNKAALIAADKQIRTKIEGGTGDDTARWTIQTTNGPMSYSVDTDF